MQVVGSGLAGWSLKVSDLRLSREESSAAVFIRIQCVQRGSSVRVGCVEMMVVIW